MQKNKKCKTKPQKKLKNIKKYSKTRLISLTNAIKFVKLYTVKIFLGDLLMFIFSAMSMNMMRMCMHMGKFDYAEI